MVEHHLWRGSPHKGVGHGVGARRLVEIEAEHQVGTGKQGVGLVLAPVVTHYGVRARHPLQEVWKLVGHHYGGLLAERLQVFGPAQARPYGVAVGVDVATNHYIVCAVYK